MGKSTKASLSHERRRLVETMQRLNFGRIEGLVIRNGSPVFEPAPKLTQDIKLGAQSGARPELALDDFTLRDSVSELFEHFERVRDGIIDLIEVRHGLPARFLATPTWSGELFAPVTDAQTAPSSVPGGKNETTP